MTTQLGDRPAEAAPAMTGPAPTSLVESCPAESCPAESCPGETYPAETGPAPHTPRSVEGPLYPVGLVVSGRRCLVVGGGRTAARKVRSLLRCGAAVTVVAPELDEAMRLLHEGHTEEAAEAGSLEVQLRQYERGEVAGYRLVFAATGDPNVDAAVHGDAEAAGVWVNSADDPAHCSVVLPAVWRTGAVTVSVSTDGTSPALAGWLRTRVTELLGDHVGELAALLGEARRRLQREGRATDTVDWLAILEGPVPALVAEGRLADAEAALEGAVEVRSPTGS